MDLFFQCAFGVGEVVLSPAGSGGCCLFHYLCCRNFCIVCIWKFLFSLVVWSEITLRAMAVTVKW